MPTAIVDEDEIHFGHPEKETTTFCGETYNIREMDRVASFQLNFDEVVARVATEEEDAEPCQDCLVKAEEYKETII